MTTITTKRTKLTRPLEHGDRVELLPEAHGTLPPGSRGTVQAWTPDDPAGAIPGANQGAPMVLVRWDCLTGRTERGEYVANLRRID